MLDLANKISLFLNEGKSFRSFAPNYKLILPGRSIFGTLAKYISHLSNAVLSLPIVM
jgi:hypothetical protein